MVKTSSKGKKIPLWEKQRQDNFIDFWTISPQKLSR